jgi:hypothetical protein
MRRWYKYHFSVDHGCGEHLITIVAHGREQARQMLLMAEGCPARAVHFIRKSTIKADHGNT